MSINSLRKNSEERIQEIIDIELIESEITKYLANNDLASIELYKDNWILHNQLLENRINLDFSKLIDYSNLNKNLEENEFILSVKFWIVNLFSELSSKTISDYFKGFLNLVRITDGLTNFNEDIIISKLNEDKAYKIRNTMLAGLSYFEMYSDDYGEEVFEVLYNLGRNFDMESHLSRLLPPNRDIIVFSKVLDTYFSSELSELEYLRYFPIWLWWKLTTIIPMRISEFCLLRRNCITLDEGKNYITIKRIKSLIKDKEPKIQKLLVPEYIVKEIKKYQKMVKYKKGEELLISYVNIPNYSSKGGYLYFSEIRTANKNVRVFSRGVFTKLLYSFYQKIIGEKYNFYCKEDDNNLDYCILERKLRPGDTRHLAFINLKRQGLHPIEIAYIGGHKKLQSQQHYFNHLSNFVDLEILEIIIKDDMHKLYDSSMHNAIDLSFVDRFVLRPIESNFKIKLKLGYCTDSEQDCTVESCFNCDYWRISPDEFLEKKSEIIEAFADVKNELSIAITNLKEIYMKIYNEISDYNIKSYSFEINTDLKKSSAYLDNVINRYLNLAKINERVLE